MPGGAGGYAYHASALAGLQAGQQVVAHPGSVGQFAIPPGHLLPPLGAGGGEPMMSFPPTMSPWPPGFPIWDPGTTAVPGEQQSASYPPMSPFPPGFLPMPFLLACGGTPIGGAAEVASGKVGEQVAPFHGLPASPLSPPGFLPPIGGDVGTAAASKGGQVVSSGELVERPSDDAFAHAEGIRSSLPKVASLPSLGRG